MNLPLNEHSTKLRNAPQSITTTFIYMFIYIYEPLTLLKILQGEKKCNGNKQSKKNTNLSWIIKLGIWQNYRQEENQWVASGCFKSSVRAMEAWITTRQGLWLGVFLKHTVSILIEHMHFW